MWPSGNVAVVTPTSPHAWRRLAYQCARLPQRENGYDFPSFDVGDGGPAVRGERAYLYRIGDRVVGFVSVDDARQVRWWPAIGEPAAPIEGPPRPVLGVIFTAHFWRRGGIARALVTAVSAHTGWPQQDLGWQSPFTPAGKALRSSISPDGWWQG